MSLACRLTLALWWLRTQRERLQIAVAWCLPRWLVYWATIRLFAHGTTGQYGSTEPDALRIFEALRRWTEPRR